MIRSFFVLPIETIGKLLRDTPVLNQREELTWLEHERIDNPLFYDFIGTRGIRQVGRLMMMDRSRDFMNKGEQEINIARKGLSDPIINIYIVSGLTGGTGSGCFLDVCYMVRSITQYTCRAQILGCFFPSGRKSRKGSC